MYPRSLIRAVMLISAISTVSAQQSTPPQGVSTAQQILLSGRQAQPGSVDASLSTAPSAAADGALVTRGTVNVQGAYQGSVPTTGNTGTVFPLRLDFALSLALRQNLGAVTQSHSVKADRKVCVSSPAAGSCPTPTP